MGIDTGIPASWGLPLFWGTVDGSMAGRAAAGQPALLVGHPLFLGAAMPNVPIACKSLANAKQLFGEGSMLERMVARFLDNNETSEFWCMAIPQPVASIAATGSITLAVAAGLQSGLLSTYIAGTACPITVYQTDTAATIAARLAAAINALGILPVVAAVDGINTSKVNLTSKWQGLTANDIKLGFNQLGLYGGESFPIGLTTSTTVMVNGAGTPDFTAGIAAIAAKQFYTAAVPFTDTASLKVWDAEFGFANGGRWSFIRQMYGWIVNYARFSYADAMVWGPQQNSAVISTMAIETTSPTPVWEWTAAYAGQAAGALLDDPARPLQTLELAGCVPAPVESRFHPGELNDLQNNGFAVQDVAPSGNAKILCERLQYQANAFGQRIGGVIDVTADGLQLAIRGNFEVSPSRVKREGVAGQDYVHGYVETPLVPGMKGDITTTPDISLEDLEAITDATVQASLANGKSYVLSEAWTKAAFTIGTAEGKFGIEFEGTTCDEI